MKQIVMASAVILVTWLSGTGCIQMKQDECSDDYDCLGYDVCKHGECVEPDSGTGGSSGGSKSESGGTSGGSTSEGGGSTPGPSCTDLRSGVHDATNATSICTPEITSVSVTIGNVGRVESVDGRSCSLTRPGTSCYSTVPDKYDCNGCEFNVEAETTNGSDVVGWTVSPTCADTACADYCCVTESNVIFAADYWLDQYPTSGAGGSSGASGGSGGSNPRDPCAGCGYPFCDGTCAGCC